MNKKLFVSLKSKKPGSQPSQSFPYPALNTLLTYLPGEKLAHHSFHLRVFH
jgi:hypothetical protein